MLTLSEVERTVVGRTLFASVTFTVHPGDRIGLIGPNGAGKTTLLRIVAGHEEPDAGRVLARPGLRRAYLPQEVESEIAGDAPLIEAALAATDEVRRLGAECERLAEEMAAAAGDPADAARLEELTATFGERRALFEWFGGDHLETRARVVLGGLGFTPEDFERPVRTFSGGWRMRALMARLLLSGADLLLLDEPTNHLDLDALAWLENHLASSPAAMIVVTHDRVFLDKVATRVADFHGEKLRFTPGGWSRWLKVRAAEQEQAERRARKLEREAGKLRTFVERFHAKATKAAAAKDKARLLADVQNEQAQLERGPAAATWRLRWPDPPPAADPLVQLERVGKSFGARTVLAGVELHVRPGDRLAVMGPNGAGKTTLLRLLAGELLADSGRRHFGRGLRVGYFAQHQLETMDPQNTVLNEARSAAAGRTPEDVRAVLGALGLGELHVDRAVATLSGGERARLALARLLLRPSNLLLLDEPTNHLDLPLREALEESLSRWTGALLVVSHDRAFLDRLTNGVIAVEQGVVQRLSGGWSEWLAWRASRAGRGGDATAPAAVETLHERSRAGRRARAEALQERGRRLKPLRDAVSRTEKRIHHFEQRLAEIDARLADPTVHAQGALMRELALERDALERELALLYPEWEQAAHRLEEEDQRET